jgi:hypothetical protein
MIFIMELKLDFADKSFYLSAENIFRAKIGPSV